MTYIPANYSTTAFSFASLVSFFRSHDALSEGKAIQVNDLDWMEMGFISDPTVDRFKPYYVAAIQKTSDGKFWLDINKLKALHERQFKVNKGFLLGFGAFFQVLAIILFLTSIVTANPENFGFSIIFLVGGFFFLLLPFLSK